MNTSQSNPYQAAFFVVPSHILNLPGLTLVYLRVYETIFQFWNHGKPCFMGTQVFLNRLHISRSQLFEAFLFFERNGELIRRSKNGKRYFVQPERSIEVDCPKNILESGRADCQSEGVRQSGLGESGRADYNNKNINKEDTTYSLSRGEEILFDLPKDRRKAIRAKTLCLESRACLELYEQLPQEVRREKSLRDVHQECSEHYASMQYPIVTTEKRFQSWIKREFKYSQSKPEEPKQYRQPRQSGTDAFNEMMRKHTKGHTYDHA